MPTSHEIGPVESGIPLKNKRGTLRTAIEEMKKGDSRLIRGYRRTYIYAAAESSGMVVRVSADGDGYRVWRVA